MSSEITNYDVLLTRDVNGFCTILSPDHVGNRRFAVLLDIHREQYALARQGRHDTSQCEHIVDKIINTVCRECVPNGRFLEQDSGNSITYGVRQLFPPEIRVALHISLGGAPLEPEQQIRLHPLVNTSRNPSAFQNQIVFAEMSRRRELLQRSISESMVQNFHQNFPPPPSRNIIRAQSDDITHVPPEPDVLAISDPFIPSQPTPNTIKPELSAPSLEPLPLEQALDASLEPHHLHQMEDRPVPMRQSLPPLDRRAMTQEMQNMWESAPNILTNNFMAPLLPPLPESSMNVVIGLDHESVSSLQHAGNNRFRILVNLQCKAFHGGNPQEQERILNDIVLSVNSWNGTFLLETPSGYQTLSASQAKQYIQAILRKLGLREMEVSFLKWQHEKRKRTRALGSKQRSDSNFNYRHGDGDDDAMMS